VPRRVAAAALVLALALACGGEAPPASCPGEPVARFGFQGTLVGAADPRIAGQEPPSTAGTADCPSAWFPAQLEGFEGTLSADPASSAAALCRTPGTVLYGPRTGDHFVLETSTDGAVLGQQCAPTCSAGLRLVVAGDVVRDAAEPVSFAGVLVEVMSAAAGSICGACTLPCAARYALEGTR
jgi:hypothetical protein